MPDPRPADAPVDATLAVGLVLARMAAVDEVVSPEEHALLDQLGRRLEPPRTVASLLEIAAETPLASLAAAVDNSADRFFLAARAWAMAKADGMLDERERDLFVELVEVLELSESDCAKAREAVWTQPHGLDPELEAWLRDKHAGSSFSPPAAVPGGDLAALRDALGLAQARARQALATSLQDLAADQLPDDSAAVVEAAAQALGVPLLLEVLDDLDRQSESDQRRLELLESSDDLLEHADRAEGLGSRRRKAHMRIEALSERRAAFEREDFRWLYARNHHADHQRDAFQQFMRVVTLASWRERRAEDEALAALRVPDFRCAVEEFHRLERDLRHAQRELDRVGHAETALSEMILERSDLRLRVEQQRERRLAVLRGVLVDHLGTVPLDQVGAGLPAGAQRLLAHSRTLECTLWLYRDLALALDRLAGAPAAVETVQPVVDVVQAVLQTAEHAALDLPGDGVGSLDRGAVWDTLLHDLPPVPPATLAAVLPALDECQIARAAARFVSQRSLAPATAGAAAVVGNVLR